MGKGLIIAEKPSVAADIARALGGFKKKEDHYESAEYMLASAVGHLLEIDCPEEFEAKGGKWKFSALPVIPPRFDLVPREKSEGKLRTLQKLIRSKDVDTLVNACDAGREGELIFRYLVQYTAARQPIHRLWLQSMTPAAIREGFDRLRTDAQMRPLADAAVCRSEADWLVGINGTRAMTAFNSKSGGFVKTTVGRVQTPTLAILVEREDRIRKFVSREYWELHATFAAHTGTYAGRWFDEKFRKDPNDTELKAERLWDPNRAIALRDQCLGQPGIVTEESKPTTQLSPLLFDLTSLQREANARFGFSAQTTLSLAQSLYERHKAVTYPRTDSRALPEDYLATVRRTLECLQKVEYASFAGRILSEGWVAPNRRIFNNEKISDHFAIIPTPELPHHLSEVEAKLYDFITRRFLAVFYPPAEFLVTTRITRVRNEPFRSEGRILVSAGWMEVYGREAQSDENPTLTPVQPGEQVQTETIDIKRLQTKAPPRYSEATLLSAMEGAGKLVEDEELREAMSQRGLGTPATRAAIIEGLLAEKYIVRNGKELQPTAKAFSLMALLRGLGVEELTTPELTGEWEFKLKQMEQGRLTRTDFMRGIEEMTRHIVERAKSYEHDTVPGDFGTLHVGCPKCGGEVHERYKTFQCVKCDWSMYKIILSRQFEPEEVEQLLGQGRAGPLLGFRSKQGRPFNAMMKLGPAPDFRIEFDFGESTRTENGDPAAPPDFTGQEPVGSCPKCHSHVFELGTSYVCEKAVGNNRQCNFRAGKIILHQQIERPQMQKLLAAAKTDLLEKFISKRGRPFRAFLVLKDGGVGFEFPPRETKGAAAKGRTRTPPTPIDFTGRDSIGTCPKCGGRVFETETYYLCEKSQAKSRPCRFKTGKTILGRDLRREEFAHLLTEGRTPLLANFVSIKTGRPFSAYLVVGDGGRVQFEFPDRDETPPTG